MDIVPFSEYLQTTIQESSHTWNKNPLFLPIVISLFGNDGGFDDVYVYACTGALPGHRISNIDFINEIIEEHGTNTIVDNILITNELKHMVAVHTTSSSCEEITLFTYNQYINYLISSSLLDDLQYLLYIKDIIINYKDMQISYLLSEVKELHSLISEM